MGVAVATATLTGALLVGDSMRGSLRDLALRRLGPVDHAMVARRFFREQLATEIAADAEFTSRFDRACPAVLVSGSANHADTRARVNRINVLGVDDRFWSLAGSTDAVKASASDRTVTLNEPLAIELGAKAGDDILLRLEKHRTVPVETLLGRPDDATQTVRLSVDRVLPTDGLGGFAVRQTQAVPRNAFVPLAVLQRAMKQQGRVNAILVTGSGGSADPDSAAAGNDVLQSLLTAKVNLDDFNLHVRADQDYRCVSLESNRLLIEPVVEAEAIAAAQAIGAPTTAILTYLANSMTRLESLPTSRDAGQGETDAANAITQASASQETAASNQPTIPYSTVSAVDATAMQSGNRFLLADGTPAPALGRDDILLNGWAAANLGARVGDRIRLAYYVTRPFGRLETVESAFTLRGIVQMLGWAADAGMTPRYEGITDVKNLSDWDPPFPIDMAAIREADERYWDEYGATPKAFVSLTTGRELWAGADARFGRSTAVRIEPADGLSLDETTAAFERRLLDRLAPAQLGLSFEPVRQQALASSRGGTDFGGLFIGMSFFLIIAAALLVAILFRLGVERRSREIGTLLAVGFSARQVARMLLAQGALVAALGTAVGLVGASGYAWLMLAGLRSWWAGAVNAPFLQLHTSPTSFAIGFVASFTVAMLSVAWAIRGLSRMSPRALLAGVVQSGRAAATRRGARVSVGVTVGSLLIGGVLLALSAWTDTMPTTGAFFGGGAAVLVACLGGLWIWTGTGRHELIARPGPGALVRLGIRNATRNRGRSLLTTGLIASATFVIVAVGANRHGVHIDSLSQTSPTGGFLLMAEAAVPIQHDLNTPSGRESLNLEHATTSLLGSVTVVPFRLKPGDDASCLNLYKVRQPRILGATTDMIERGGFTFSASQAETDEQRENPWILLHKTFDDGAVPAIGDYNTLKWLLKVGLGQDLIDDDELGNPVHLRMVGMLAGSVLQGELVIAEDRFVRMFPSIAGHGFFLIESPPSDASRLRLALERDLNIYGFDVESTNDALAKYMAVENTYISTFQTLGGLGLLLGTLGLGAVMLRNVLERRGELALLRAVGYRWSALAWVVLTENAMLLVWGLLAGSVSALLAVAPHATSSPGDIPWLSLGATLAAVLIVGMLAGIVALTVVVRAPLLPALRSE